MGRFGAVVIPKSQQVKLSYAAKEIKKAKNATEVMEVVMVLTEIAGALCTEAELEFMDLDEVQDSIVEFLSNVEELEED